MSPVYAETVALRRALIATLPRFAIANRLAFPKHISDDTRRVHLEAIRCLHHAVDEQKQSRATFYVQRAVALAWVADQILSGGRNTAGELSATLGILAGGFADYFEYRFSHGKPMGRFEHARHLCELANERIDAHMAVYGEPGRVSRIKDDSGVISGSPPIRIEDKGAV